MYGPFVHRIDPVFGEVAGFYLWFYGLSYSLGFLSIFLWFKRIRHRFGLTIDAVYSLTFNSRLVCLSAVVCLKSSSTSGHITDNTCGRLRPCG
jgi:prolipoprotein diacylglyceryltransferase